MMKKMKLYMSKNERDELEKSISLIDDIEVRECCRAYVRIFDEKFERNLKRFDEIMKETGSDQKYSDDNKEFFVTEYPEVIKDYLESRKDVITEIPYFLEKQVLMRK